MATVSTEIDLQKSSASNTLAWVLNVSSSVLIVFVNKILMDSSFGYKFVYGEISSESILSCPSKLTKPIVLSVQLRRCAPSIFFISVCGMVHRDSGIQHTGKATFCR